MAANIVETIQKNLGLPPLKKIDPNIQEAKDLEYTSTPGKLAQAAVPAVLTALYRLSKTEEGSASLLFNRNADECMTEIFHGHSPEAVAKVAEYAGTSPEVAGDTMKKVAFESVRTLQQALGNDPSYEKIRNYMNGQRHNILVHLPATLHMGDILNDETLDDRTNKMEGPVSSMMHKIENKLSAGEQTQGTF